MKAKASSGPAGQRPPENYTEWCLELERIMMGLDTWQEVLDRRPFSGQSYRLAQENDSPARTTHFDCDGAGDTEESSDAPADSG